MYFVALERGCVPDTVFVRESPVARACSRRNANLLKVFMRFISHLRRHSNQTPMLANKIVTIQIKFTLLKRNKNCLCKRALQQKITHVMKLVFITFRNLLEFI